MYIICLFLLRVFSIKQEKWAIVKVIRLSFKMRMFYSFCNIKSSEKICYQIQKNLYQKVSVKRNRFVQSISIYLK